MSSKDITVKVENLSKCYRIGVKDEMHDSFVNAMFDFVKSPLKKYRKYRSLYKFDDIDLTTDSNLESNPSDIIWALRDVSCEVYKGEVLGIIGKNGAGKSTLLKILSKITDPTRGRAVIYGKVSSLLEVGTGFHPELTGRENVYLNATILGMAKKEIDQKFDEIVDFSGVERFIDTPVKRYSSGMKVRLGFSVAAHLEPEVLVVDEVLAVGDFEFQKKCLGKMETVAQEGRTVLFVSHNMAAISKLCTRTILIENGRITLNGPSSLVVSEYLSSASQVNSTWSFSSIKPDDDNMQISSVRVLSKKNTPCSVFKYGSTIKYEIAYNIFQPISGLCVICQLSDSKNNIIWTSWDADTTDWKHRKTTVPGSYIATFTDSLGVLGPGSYYFSVGSTSKEVRFPFYNRILNFEVSDVGYYLNPGREGIIKPILKCEVRRTEA